MPKMSVAGLPVVLALAACQTLTSPQEQVVGEAAMQRADGSAAGTATLVRVGDTLALRVSASGLADGQHGFHLHTAGRCEAPAFTSAGGHLNPANRQHGLQSPSGAHLGDMRNLEVSGGAVRNARIDVQGPADATLASIFDTDGTAVIIHARADDYVTDPTGNAGDRLACGVLERR